MASAFLALLYSSVPEKCDQTQSGDSSVRAPGASAVVENAKSFIAGGYGGICAVLVGA